MRKGAETMLERLTLTVSQLNLYIKDIFGQIPILADIRVKGEISNFKHHYSGHMYMSLKDESGVVKAVMFRSAAAGLNFKPENGMKVVAEGRVSVYERDGIYQLYINSMTPDGKGDLHEAFEKLKAKLGAEGLFDETHKKPLPAFPRRVGVVTAPTGAAVRDIINIISRRFSRADIVLYPVQVQGAVAAQSIAAAISEFGERRDIDVLIVGRGGGSIEDLWAFNEEIVARAIYACDIPIISAVGHETDFTIADFVADMRAPTPSAAAELAVPSAEELKARIAALRTRMVGRCEAVAENSRLRLRILAESRAMKTPLALIGERGMYLDGLTKSLEDLAVGTIEKKKTALVLAASRLDGLSPLGTLGRGYSVVRAENGEVVKKSSQLKCGDKIFVTLGEGEIDAAVL